ncbi:MAG: NB-ARC domain-containing protein [Chloroflexota bacterium]|nr:NB-ARC domain-containing protein [Chloroflexota bacterium]
MADPPLADRTVLPSPPLVSLNARGQIGKPPPVLLTSFVGREREVKQAAVLLRRGDVRLVTLTGPGGVGKTRIALKIAKDVAAVFRDGVAFVSLAAITDPDLVAPVVAQALSIHQAGDRPLVEHLASVLRERHLLLLLDNFEQIVDAAALVTNILAACPSLTVLVTSRTTLRVSGEHVFPVSPLALPDPEEGATAEVVGRAEAVRLFLTRAAAVRPGLALTDENASLVADICRRLDGLPLAVELAAARSNVLPPVALLARLGQRLPLLTGGPRDAPARLRTMRDAIAWSHGLLSPEEQVLFGRLAVFTGGFTMEAAQAVAGDAVQVLDGVSSLVSASLLRQEEGLDGEPRFAMLETIREYGLERLEAQGDAEAAHRAHATWFLRLAEQAEPHIPGPHQAAWGDLLEVDLPNLRAGLEWLEEAGDTERLVRLAGSLIWFWYMRDRLDEGRAWLGRALSMSTGVPNTARAKVLVGMAFLAYHQGNVDQAVLLGEEGLVVSRASDHAPGIALSLYLLGLTAEDAGRYDEA